jgi:hypothetical protein
MKLKHWYTALRAVAAVIIGLLSCLALIMLLLLLERPSLVKAAEPAPLNPSHDQLLTEKNIPLLNGISPTLELVAFQPAQDEYLFTVRLRHALSDTQYVITTYHHTDIDYPQRVVTVTTDGAGMASAKIWSRCTYQDVLTGTVFAQLALSGVFQVDSNHLDCPALKTIGDFGSHLIQEPANNDWIYRPSPPGPTTMRVWVRDAQDRSGLTGTIRIDSAGGYELEEQGLVDEGNGLYAYEWSMSGLLPADDYRIQLTLSDGAGGLSGLDAFVKLTGRSTWVWGAATETGNPMIWAILTNEDYDGNGVGERDEWLAFHQPYDTPDPYVSTSYLSIYPYLGYTGTLVTDTIQNFLTVTHNTGNLRVEALAGTYAWVTSTTGLQEGKDLCDTILNFNRAGTSSAERFDGIHYDVEHDDWEADNRWDRFIELITYCQTQVDVYNQTHEPIIFGVDIPPHFLTGPESSGAVKSGWDVLNIVDYLTLMDYRDFAQVRWNGRKDGIITRATSFVADGNTLGKPIIIGVELTENNYDHVTFFEECPLFMENELTLVSRYFATDWSYKAIAIHDYAAWKDKESCDVFLPAVLNNE